MKNSNHKNKLSVAMFLPTFVPLEMGGSENQAKKLAQSLINDGINVCIITPGKHGLAKQEFIEGIPVYRFITIHQQFKDILSKFRKRPYSPQFENVVFDYTNYKGSKSLYPKYRNVIIEFIACIDVFICSLLILYRKRNIYNIIQINTITRNTVIIAFISKILIKKIVIKDSTMNGILQMPMTPFPNFSRKFIIKTGNFVAMTKIIEDNYKLVGIPSNKICRIPNGIEILNEEIHIRQSNDLKCLFVGNLYQQPAKGIDVLIKAWPKVIESFPEAKLTIVGDGNISAYNQFIMNNHLNDSIFFTGKADPEKYYPTHDLFILPSRREGMSNALIEAMLNGMPTVVTNISGNIDLVEHKINGFVTNVNDHNSLAEGIIYMLDNKILREKCSINNKEKIKKLCNLKDVSRLYSSLYRSLIN